MLGACGHAEEWALWDIVRRGIPLYECDLYIAGFYNNGLPWFKTEPNHTCLRCSVQMNYAKIHKVYVPVVNRWEGISIQEALKTAVSYAIGQKRV